MSPKKRKLPIVIWISKGVKEIKEKKVTDPAFLPACPGSAKFPGPAYACTPLGHGSTLPGSVPEAAISPQIFWNPFSKRPGFKSSAKAHSRVQQRVSPRSFLILSDS
jgi:hypothetical protein